MLCRNLEQGKIASHLVQKQLSYFNQRGLIKVFYLIWATTNIQPGLWIRVNFKDKSQFLISINIYRN